MSKLHLISGSGRCHPFDSRGDGYGRGEGCVVLVLKRLDAALRDRDPVRAILVNTGVNQDGYTPAGITSPNVSQTNPHYERFGDPDPMVRLGHFTAKSFMTSTLQTD